MDQQENNVNGDLGQDAGNQDNDDVPNNEGMDALEEGIHNMNQYEPGAELDELVIVERELDLDDEVLIDEDWRESEPEDLSQESFSDEESQQQYEIVRSSRHEYLGDTEEVCGRTVVEEDDYITIPIPLPSSAHNLVLLPNQTLPLTIFCPMQQSVIRKVISKDKIIGIIHTRGGKFQRYGTTAEIYEYHAEEGGPSLSIKAKGRQRFKVVDIHRETTGCIVAKVKILPEIRMPDPLQHVHPAGQRRGCDSGCGGEAGQRLQSKDLDGVRSPSWRCARRVSSLLTPWPAWVYDMYDEERLAARLVNGVVAMFDMAGDAIQIPRDPCELSHWAAINLPLSDPQRLSLLAINTAAQRLRYILAITSNNSNGLHCSHCGSLIARTCNIFCMSTDGPQGTFVNPDGYVHEMVTVTVAKHVVLLGRACTRHSWFPGYSWRIANCSTCRSHLGWQFTAEENLKPRSFYGITRLAVKTRLTEDSDPPQHGV